MKTNKPFFSFKGARTVLYSYGITISLNDGEYKVRVKGSPKSHGYFTDDIDDAVKTGILMADEKPLFSLAIQGPLFDELSIINNGKKD